MSDKKLDNKENNQYETAIFAGGCFWCMVEPFDTQPGIISVVSGYTGGMFLILLMNKSALEQQATLKQ